MPNESTKFDSLGLEGLHFGIPLPKLLQQEPSETQNQKRKSKKRKRSLKSSEKLLQPDEEDDEQEDPLPKRGRKLLQGLMKRAKIDTLKVTDGLKEARLERVGAYKEMRDDMYSLRPAVEKRRLETTLDYTKIGQSDYVVETPNGAVKECRAAYELKDLWRAAKAEAAGKILTTHLQHLISSIPEKYTEVKLKLASGEDEHTDCARALQDELQRQRRDIGVQRAMRARISAQQAQNHITGKIKSKSYHRALRKRSLKKEADRLERLKLENPEEYKKVQEDMEKRRVEERLTQRHRSGKFAQLTKILGKRSQNPESRSALVESLELARERLKKNDLDIPDDSEEDDDATSESSEDEDKRNKDDSDEGSIDEKASENQLNSNETASKQSSTLITKITSLPNTVPAASNLAESVMRINASLPANKTEKEFQREMEKEREEGLLQQMGNQKFLPGWNAWTGPGMDIVNKRREKEYRKKRLSVIKVKPSIISSGNLGYVRNFISKETKAKLVKSIAFPYNTPEQFNEVLSEPVMREFTTEVFHRKKIAPKVKVRAGAIVQPVVVSSKNK